MFVSIFSTQKAYFEESKYKNCVWLGIKCNFLEKVVFWVCEENAQSEKGALRCILEKVHARCHISVGRSWAITKLLFNKSCSCSQFSRLFLIPLISSLCSTFCPEAHSRLSSLLSALPSPCCYKPLCGKSLSCLLSSVESSSSSSSSFFVFFNALSPSIFV